MIKMEHTIDQYRNGKPSVIVEGSKAQVLFALEDSRTDVLRIASHLETLERENATLRTQLDEARKAGEKLREAYAAILRAQAERPIGINPGKRFAHTPATHWIRSGDEQKA